MNISFPPKFKLSEDQRKVNFALDREKFEKAMSKLNCRAIEVYTDMRTESGYSGVRLDTLFQGFCLAQDLTRNIIEFPLIQHEPAPIEPGEKLLEIHRCTSVFYGDFEFTSPGRQDTGVSIGYVRTNGSLWPKAWDGDNIVYTDHHTTGAEYIDIIAMPHFDMHEDDFKTTCEEAAEFARQILQHKYTHVKTSLTIPCVGKDGRMASLVRLTITHDEFLKDQVRYKNV
jgi:hypothetical protein